MKIIPNKLVEIDTDQVAAIRKSSRIESLRNEFPAFCDCCGFAAMVSLTELHTTCPKCTPEGNSVELKVYTNDPIVGWDKPLVLTHQNVMRYWERDQQLYCERDFDAPWVDRDKDTGAIIDMSARIITIRCSHDSYVVLYSGDVIETINTSPRYFPLEVIWNALVEKYGTIDLKVDGDEPKPPPHLWATDVIKESGTSLWCMVRLYLESKRSGSFENFLDSLEKPQKYTDVFQVLYEEYRQNDHVSAGFRTAAWDMLGMVTLYTIPGYEDCSERADVLEDYAATLKEEWKDNGMDIIPIEDWMDTQMACDMYLEADKESASAFALGLGFLVMEFEKWSQTLSGLPKAPNVED